MTCDMRKLGVRLIMANTGFLYYRICITVSVWVLLSQGWVNLSGWMNGARDCPGADIVSIYGSWHMMLYVMKCHFLEWRMGVAIHKKVEQVLIQAGVVDLHGVCMGFFPFNSNGISFAAQLHDDTSIKLRHQTLHLTRDDIQLNVQPTTV